jgi:hypothetical protein
LEQLQKDIEKLSTKRPIMIVDQNRYWWTNFSTF